MFTHLPHQGPRPRTAGSGRPRLRRLAAVLAAVTCGLLASAAIVPAASAMIVPDPGGAGGGTPLAPAPADHRPRSHRRGMAGWQITFIAPAPP